MLTITIYGCTVLKCHAVEITLSDLWIDADDASGFTV
jgi:hypothetical protein